eukprot:TRINITY_DN15661_c0_g1_i3.p3 TRINITY_DN15661_c0_g1~~TRINITY_DN15661_c0_g1_i3.p3  ORF type:complete len:112 (-),score=29.15 TRINITY_DN15661_c0_g1_i3:57-392(-)
MSEPVELIDKVEFLRSTQNMQNNPTTIVEQQPQHQEEPVSKQQEKKIEQVHQIDKKFSSLCKFGICLLYTSDAADDMQCVDLGGRRIIKKKNTHHNDFWLQIQNETQRHNG